MLRGRPGSARRGGAGVLAAVTLYAAPAPAQDSEYRPPPRMSVTHASLQWILGRYRMPVTCERADGSRIELEEAVVFRPAVDDRRGATVKATFFGIDVPDVERCFNLIEPRVPDRRGVLFITFLGHDRPDVGLSQLRRELEDGELRYQVRRGNLHIRPLGADAEPRVVELGGGRAELVVRLVRPRSDPGKLLASYARQRGEEGAPLRRIELLLSQGDAPVARGYYLEDGSR